MESKHLRVWVERQGLDVVKIVFLVTWSDRVVNSTWRELVAFNQDFRVDIALKNSANQTNILDLSHTTSVVDLGTEHVKHFVGNFIVRFNELLQLTSADNQILIREGVWDIPANRTELSSVLNNGVEEAEAEENLLVDLWLGALLEIL